MRTVLVACLGLTLLAACGGRTPVVESDAGADGAASADAQSSCAELTDEQSCTGSGACHPVYEDDEDCPCDVVACCVRFVRCAEGQFASCFNGPPSCRQATPYCEGPYQVGNTPDGSCYEGCVRTSDCIAP